MKELTIEEKAKAYDEAIEKLHEIITMDNKPVNPKEIWKYLFPELKESEDEGIRKDIIRCLQYSGIKPDRPINPHVRTTMKDALVWLEKQAEQKSTKVKTTGYWNVQDVEQKPAWTEEDETRIKQLLGWIDTLKNYIHYDAVVPADLRIERIDKIVKLESWLKSPKQKNRWKPTENQIKALHDLNITGNISNVSQGQTLIELYNDLKKL